MKAALATGAVLERFQRWVAAQGGDLGGFERRLGAQPAVRRITVSAPRAGVVAAMDATAIGEIARTLGAGRLAVGDGMGGLPIL